MEYFHANVALIGQPVRDFHAREEQRTWRKQEWFPVLRKHQGRAIRAISALAHQALSHLVCTLIYMDIILRGVWKIARHLYVPEGGRWKER